jgi:TetR/AcrR family fatty acid metabolism transcriptional regulator
MMEELQSASDREVRRRAILEAAVGVFARRGFFNSRTREIAEAAGIAEGTIYLYFEGKDDLLLTAFREKVSEFITAADDLLELGGSLEERLYRFVELQFAGGDWLAREILKEAGDAIVLEPEEARESVREAATELAGAPR